MNSLKIDYEVAVKDTKALVDNYLADGYTLGDNEHATVRDLVVNIAVEMIIPLTDEEVFAEYFNLCLQVLLCP